MKTQNFNEGLEARARPLNGRRPAEKGLGLGVALLGIVCVVGVFGLLALLFHAG